MNYLNKINIDLGNISQSAFHMDSCFV